MTAYREPLFPWTLTPNSDPSGEPTWKRQLGGTEVTVRDWEVDLDGFGELFFSCDFVCQNGVSLDSQQLETRVKRAWTNIIWNYPSFFAEIEDVAGKDGRKAYNFRYEPIGGHARDEKVQSRLSKSLMFHDASPRPAESAEAKQLELLKQGLNLRNENKGGKYAICAHIFPDLENERVTALFQASHVCVDGRTLAVVVDAFRRGLQLSEDPVYPADFDVKRLVPCYKDQSVLGQSSHDFSSPGMEQTVSKAFAAASQSVLSLPLKDVKAGKDYDPGDHDWQITQFTAEKTAHLFSAFKRNGLSATEGIMAAQVTALLSMFLDGSPHIISPFGDIRHGPAIACDALGVLNTISNLPEVWQGGPPPNGHSALFVPLFYDVHAAYKSAGGELTTTSSVRAAVGSLGRDIKKSFEPYRSGGSSEGWVYSARWEELYRPWFGVMNAMTRGDFPPLPSQMVMCSSLGNLDRYIPKLETCDIEMEDLRFGMRDTEYGFGVEFFYTFRGKANFALKLPSRFRAACEYGPWEEKLYEVLHLYMEDQ